MFKQITTSLLLIFSLDSIANSDNLDIKTGQIWSLESKSNRLSTSNSEVLFFFSNDAYNTYQARRFSDWDQFSIVDGRDLVRLNTGDKIKIIKSKHHEKIYEVMLLDGFSKNRSYFVITEDLLKDFIIFEEQSNET
jgi:hypothetical protein|tara:strand:- start:139 stop:546 length:408 start_codon:yes stop_codon:yes gene_type:complete